MADVALLLDVVGAVGSPADLATLLLVVAKFAHDIDPRLDTISAAVVALASGRRDVDHERLQHDLGVDDVAVDAVRPTIADGGFPAEDEPDGAVLAPHHFYVGMMVAAFGFVSVWPFYPATGAVMTLVGTLVLLDDVLSHVFGVWTPLDWVWRRFIVGRLS